MLRANIFRGVIALRAMMMPARRSFALLGVRMMHYKCTKADITCRGVITYHGVAWKQTGY